LCQHRLGPITRVQKTETALKSMPVAGGAVLYISIGRSRLRFMFESMSGADLEARATIPGLSFRIGRQSSPKAAVEPQRPFTSWIVSIPPGRNRCARYCDLFKMHLQVGHPIARAVGHKTFDTAVARRRSGTRHGGLGGTPHKDA